MKLLSLAGSIILSKPIAALIAPELNMDNFFVLIATMIIFLAIILWPIANSFRRHPKEIGKTKIYSESCSIRYGSMGLVGGSNLPFSQITMYPDFLIISGYTKTVVEYKDIDVIKSMHGVHMAGIGGVQLKLKGMQSTWYFFPREPEEFVKLIQTSMQNGH